MGKRRKTPADLVKAQAADAVPLPAWLESGNPYSDGEEEDDSAEPEKRLPGRPRGTTKLQCQWDKAIIALLTIPTVEGAAEAIGVSKATLFNWLRNDEFKSQLNEIRRHGMLQAILAIYGSMGKTMQTLMEIRDDTRQPGAVRVAASKELIQLWIKFYDQEKAEELAGEKIRELQRMLDEIKNDETDVRNREDREDREERSPLAALPPGREDGEDQGA